MLLALGPELRGPESFGHRQRLPDDADAEGYSPRRHGAVRILSDRRRRVAARGPRDRPGGSRHVAVRGGAERGRAFAVDEPLGAFQQGRVLLLLLGAGLHGRGHRRLLPCALLTRRGHLPGLQANLGVHSHQCRRERRRRGRGPDGRHHRAEVRMAHALPHRVHPRPGLRAARAAVLGGPPHREVEEEGAGGSLFESGRLGLARGPRHEPLGLCPHGGVGLPEVPAHPRRADEHAHLRASIAGVHPLVVHHDLLIRLPFCGAGHGCAGIHGRDRSLRCELLVLRGLGRLLRVEALRQAEGAFASADWRHFLLGVPALHRARELPEERRDLAFGPPDGVRPLLGPLCGLRRHRGPEHQGHPHERKRQRGQGHRLLGLHALRRLGQGHRPEHHRGHDCGLRASHGLHAGLHDVVAEWGRALPASLCAAAGRFAFGQLPAANEAQVTSEPRPRLPPPPRCRSAFLARMWRPSLGDVGQHAEFGNDLLYIKMVLL
mmetsp:Transcript_66640/g.215447  ORF Transcript_66640/g.215447 Transcript_66640/m.215447 type:complete len:491 (+) Transcript_66640:492-1964(+)